MFRPVSRTVSALLVVAFFIVFGVLGSGAHHDAHCPFMPAALALCSTPAAHVSHWQALFTAALQSLLLFTAVCAVYIAFAVPETRRECYRVRRKIPLRPTLIQDLFSRGILNRKEPEPAFARVRIT